MNLVLRRLLNGKNKDKDVTKHRSPLWEGNLYRCLPTSDAIRLPRKIGILKTKDAAYGNLNVTQWSLSERPLLAVLEEHLRPGPCVDVNGDVEARRRGRGFVGA